MNIGFSTGSIAFGDFRRAIADLKSKGVKYIELSSLREGELNELIDNINSSELDYFSYVSFHAPSKLNRITEVELVNKLEAVLRKEWSIIVHPDIISDFDLWRKFGKFLCIENMDKRKPIGRTMAEMKFLFTKLPEASFCFDIAHVKQIDPTMTEAKLMLDAFRDRISQIHLSDVNFDSKHEPLNIEALLTYGRIIHLLPDVPVILESPVVGKSILKEISIATQLLNRKVV